MYFVFFKLLTNYLGLQVTGSPGNCPNTTPLVGKRNSSHLIEWLCTKVEGLSARTMRAGRSLGFRVCEPWGIFAHILKYLQRYSSNQREMFQCDVHYRQSMTCGCNAIRYAVLTTQCNCCYF